MNKDAAIENWLASMSESELIAQCFFWHDMALEHGYIYNVVNAENAKLRKELEAEHALAETLGHYYELEQAENTKLREACAELLVMAEQHNPEWLHWPEMHEKLRKLGVEVGK